MLWRCGHKTRKVWTPPTPPAKIAQRVCNTSSVVKECHDTSFSNALYLYPCLEGAFVVHMSKYLL
eukprot:4003661-Amphidinium_carterae.1